MTLGERILMYMVEAGMNQKQLAEKIGVTPTRLNYWVKDKREPDVQYIKALANTLGVSGDALLGNTSEYTDSNTTSDHSILYTSHSSNDPDSDELRKRLHELIDRLSVDDLRLLQEIIRRFEH